MYYGNGTCMYLSYRAHVPCRWGGGTTSSAVGFSCILKLCIADLCMRLQKNCAPSIVRMSVRPSVSLSGKTQCLLASYLRPCMRASSVRPHAPAFPASLSVSLCSSVQGAWWLISHVSSHAEFVRRSAGLSLVQKIQQK